MKCLSIQQPWAWAICVGPKTIENRTWQTEYRGPLLIHAGAKQGLVNDLAKRDSKFDKSWFTFGAVIGIAELVDILPMNEKLEPNPWAVGPFCWVLVRPRLFQKPIPAKGQLQVYDLAADLVPKVNEQLAHPPRSFSAESIALCRELVQQTQFERYDQLAEIYEEKKNWSNLLRICNLAIALNPNDDFLVMRAHAYLALGEPAKALEDCNSAMGLNPDNPLIYTHREQVYRALGRTEEADADKERNERESEEFWTMLERGEFRIEEDE